MRRHLISALAVSGLLATANPASAAEWVRPSAGVAVEATSGVDAPAAADAYLSGERAALGPTGVSLVRTRLLSSNGHHTVRFVQQHAGLPVIGGQAAVRVGAGGVVRAAVFEVDRSLSVAPKPTVSQQGAKATLETALGVSVATMRASLAVWPNGRGGRLTWQIDMPSRDGGMRALVDAHDGTIFQLRPLGVHALGRVYPISSVVTPATQDLELTDLVVGSPQHLTGHAGNLIVTNYVSGSAQMGDFVVEQTVEPNSGEDFLYDPPADPSDATDAFAQVMVYYHLTRMRGFYANALGLDMSDPGWALTAVANLQDNNQPVDNAFFSQMGLSGPLGAPNLIGIGQGTIDFSDDSDVFNHEFTHYVSHNAVGFNASQVHATSYGLSPFSGGIDEGISDYFACTVNDDPTLGEASLGVLGACLLYTSPSPRD